MTFTEQLAKADKIAAQFSDKDIYRLSVESNEISIHITWAAFRRAFAGKSMDVSDNHVKHVSDGVKYFAIMNPARREYQTVCPSLGDV